MYLNRENSVVIERLWRWFRGNREFSRPWGKFERTGLCCQCEGESIAEPGGSASGPWPASAWFGKSCGSIESNARQWSDRFSENIDSHLCVFMFPPAVVSLEHHHKKGVLPPPKLPGQTLEIASLQ